MEHFQLHYHFPKKQMREHFRFPSSLSPRTFIAKSHLGKIFPKYLMQNIQKVHNISSKIDSNDIAALEMSMLYSRGHHSSSRSQIS